MGSTTELSGPDLKKGVTLASVPDGGVLLGHADGEAVILSRRADDVRAIGATCTHYGGPLAEGLVEGDTIVCPWHHACFSLKTGEAVGAPAIDSVSCWNVARKGDLVVLTGKREVAPRPAPTNAPASVVIVGAGAAGGMLAIELRKQGFAGAITLIGEEASGPVDRPNLSKDYLAGKAPEEWMPLRSNEYYAEKKIDLHTSSSVTTISIADELVSLADGRSFEYEILVLATGAEPRKLDLRGAERVSYLRTLADSRAIIAAAREKKNAVVLGASFIGLEVAASLRERGLEVDVVAPDPLPLARVLGDELGAFVQKLHETHGVRFHLRRMPKALDTTSVTLDDGTKLRADLVVAGLGVVPRTELAEKGGLRCDRGIVVNDRFETSAQGVYAIGDVARHPDVVSGASVRIEHWVVAERHAQSVARAIVGRFEPYRDVPFFWSQHYDVPINYVGHAEGWDRLRHKGSIEGKDCLVGFEKNGKIVAVASIFRDTESLRAEAAMKRGDFAAVAALFD